MKAAGTGLVLHNLKIIHEIAQAKIDSRSQNSEHADLSWGDYCQRTTASWNCHCEIFPFAPGSSTD